MSTAQTWLIIGGTFNIVFSTLVAYVLFWVRARDPQKPSPHYGLIAHTSSITNGLVLIALSVVIDHTNFTANINTGLAIAEFLGTLLSNGRNLLLWSENLDDGFAQVSDTRRRIRGLGNIIHLVVWSAVLYGVTRAALGF
ncbi:MAG: hypothetical protein ABI874_05155 [Chloroflexota bacterium]